MDTSFSPWPQKTTCHRQDTCLFHLTTPYINPWWWGLTKSKLLESKFLDKNQDLFQRCTIVDRAIKKKLIMTVHPVFLSPFMDQLMGFWASNSAEDGTTYIYFLQGYWQNWPWRKHGKYDGAVQSHRTPCPTHWRTRKWVRVRNIRMAGDCWYDDGVKRYHPFSTNS